MLLSISGNAAQYIDTAILCKGKNIAQIQKTLNLEMSLCSDWFTQNKKLNVSKTKSMLFGTSH